MKTPLIIQLASRQSAAIHPNIFHRRFPKRRCAGLATFSLWLLTCAFCLHTNAQSNSIDWYKISDGGGTSTGGIYSVSGTIGQHDAGGPMTGGNFSLTGGFWSLFAVQTPGAPTLRIFLTTTNTAVVAWPAPSTGWTLQSNTNLVTTNWSGVTNAVNVVASENQVVISPPAGNKYFRLSNP